MHREGRVKDVASATRQLQNVLERGGDLFLELSHLRVYVAKPEYMLAMKCLAMRIGEGMQDENDIRYLLRHLDVERYEDAIRIVAKYYREEMIPPTAKAALREILGGD